MRFEILCLDDSEKVRSRSVKTLLHALMADDTLFSTPVMDEAKSELEDTQNHLTVSVTQFPTDKVLTGARYSVAFRINTVCECIATLDDFRIKLVDYIKSIGFTNIRILLDEVSAELAASLYRPIYTLENHVRTFVVNFFLKNLGTNWTKLAMSSDLIGKIKSRKNNDKIFVANNRIESDVTLIDFDDLGSVLYSENSILSTKKADNVTILIDKISKATDLKTLKSEVLQGNFYKYFKDCFTQKDFQSKWFDLYYYRNKVAHNGSFSKQESDKCIQLCQDISTIIDKAYEKLDTFKPSASDQEALLVAVNEFATEIQEAEIDHETRFAVITEDSLLAELESAEKELEFVGLRNFVVNILGNKGYDYDSTFTLVNFLDDKHIVQLYKVDNPTGGYPTTAIKRK